MTNEVAKTILEQLGGNAFCRMTGARNLIGYADGLSFRLPGAGGFCREGINHVDVRLLPSDTYRVIFSRVRGGKMKEIACVAGVYFDALPEIFRRETGLETRMPTVRMRA